MTESDRNFRDWKCDGAHEGVHCFERATWVHERREGSTDDLQTVITGHVCDDHVPAKALREAEAASSAPGVQCRGCTLMRKTVDVSGFCISCRVVKEALAEEARS